ncbi:ABC transporter permease [Phytohabitans aurantiacus]|uniref:ABC transporter permease n=1 Tax=Phytohabitans aurantiacus TaxID=3016789 RepID=A0ABQ5QUJ9_9ACTN|nr:ABC transporter permease [Phytohabitans aurantiacus]GLH97326.1 hypothetical protein Pa4123_26010 [Phytohabitans aurantiacus]
MSTDTLLPQARRLVAELGELPARNRLMSEFKISGPRATGLRDELIREDTRAQLATPGPAAARPRRRRPGAHLAWASRRLRQVGTDPAPPPVHVTVTAPAPQPRRRLAGAHRALASRRLREVGTKATVSVPPAAPEPITPPQATVDVPTPDPAPIAPADGGHQPPDRAARPVRAWPVLVLALPASIAIWAGWVGIGRLTGFGVVNLLPGIAPEGGWATIDTAITLPIGMEAYAAYALRVWLSGQVPARARRFARWSAIGALALGAAGQVAYHLMVAAGVTAAPWQITTALSCIPVAVLGMGAALYHLIRTEEK